MIEQPSAPSFASCHSDAAGPLAASGAPVVALVGAPNVGKSTLFNSLTGARRSVGNWPGTTVEVSRGVCLGDVPEFLARHVGLVEGDVHGCGPVECE